MLKFLTLLIGRLRQATSGARAGANHGAQARIWMIGPMPLPLNGQSNYNATIAGFFERHVPTMVLPTGGTGPEKILAGLLLPFIVLFAIPRGDHVYTSPPGQMGLWLFLPTIVALRLRRIDHFVHHHSYRPINLGPARTSRLLARIGGSYQRHVFLSERMRDQYAALYLTEAQKRRSFVLPNAFFFYDEKASPAERRGPIKIGHLSVITREKGADYLLELIEQLLAVRDDFSFVLAGPVADPVLKQEILTFCKRHVTRCSYLGSIRGDEKAEFYKSIDIFVLPTRLVDEADPLVLLEAYGYGSEILASSTGCIPERMRLPNMLIRFSPREDVSLLNQTVTRLKEHRALTAQACIQHVKAMHEKSRTYAETFFAVFGVPIPVKADEKTQ
jgi:glycosyltransferase involved in cell wall biosynthesis